MGQNCIIIKIILYSHKLVLGCWHLMFCVHIFSTVGYTSIVKYSKQDSVQTN